ncbi:WD repeat-containing protein 76 [Latimeria chalumnae]|uniref:WD repeat-containing protein 76 n=1 Tax=Latimeria chalumnae TaxID=7897 RepID=H3AEJ9_LATCH|nr:PREDICTED: WD repeat-containing protein 76 [Latimeria chalumnae]|eukprot:XP_005999745.1 PREDICTED: WD repeat-containing protein 76 [Latimeria chalumnae]
MLRPPSEESPQTQGQYKLRELNIKFTPLTLQRIQEQTPGADQPTKNMPQTSRCQVKRERSPFPTPTSANEVEAKPSNKVLPRKRLMSKYSDEGSVDEKVQLKKAKNGITSRQGTAGSTKAALSPEGVASNVKREHSMASKGSWVSVTTSDVSESDSDEDIPQMNGSDYLSAYEQKRLNNIKENAKFFSSLNILETAAVFRHTRTKIQSRGIKRIKPKQVEVMTVHRRSMRLQRLDPEGTPMPEAMVPKQPVGEYSTYALKPAGPIEMVPMNQEDSKQTGEFLITWEEMSKIKTKCSKKKIMDLERYKASLNKMAITEKHVAKIIKHRIFSIAIHPSETKVLVAAGSKWGEIGLWDLNNQVGDDGVYLFEPHSRPVNCLCFSPFNPAELLSGSYDGSMRCGDVVKAVFDEVYRNEETSVSSFDFLAEDASTLILSHLDGDVSLVDRRTPGTSHEWWAALNIGMIRTVHVHPVERHYFIAAGAGKVCIYDVRHLKQKGTKPVTSLNEHTKSVNSAYFSPVTGHKVLTTCTDDRLRVYNASSVTDDIPLLVSIRHNNYTGRWLTKFRAVWDPKQENCFVVGSMARPRQIEVFHDTGSLVHNFMNEDYLGSVCSINAMHPSRNILVGGNSSGRVHVFMD